MIKDVKSTFWTTFEFWDNKQDHTVSESSFKSSLISSGLYTASEAEQAIKEAIDQGLIIRKGYDILVKNLQSDMSKSDAI